ncbi:polymeric immunoglobulin receptor-like [Mustelus asterias]
MGSTLLLSIAFLSVTYASITGPSEKVATVGGTVQFKCRFDTSYHDYQKYWCRGFYRRSCTVLVQTQNHEMKSHDGRIKIQANNAKGELIVDMERITQNDKGWYWCGIERPHILDLLSSTELKVNQAPKPFAKDKERLRLFLTLGLIFGILTVMLLGLVILVIRKIRKHKYNDNGEKEATIENSVPKSNSVLSKELEEGVTYATVTIQPNNHPQEDSAAYDNVKPSNSQEAIKPPVNEPPASEPTEYSTVVFKKIGAGSHGVLGPVEVNGKLGGSITVNCKYNIPVNRNSEKYWCRGGRRFSCTVLAGTQRRQQERYNIVDNQTSGIFSVTMRQLSLEDIGWYWCGIARLGNDEMASVKLNVLEASLPNLRHVHGTLGEAVTLKCQYQVPYYRHHEKYLCKGSERKSCIVIARTQKQNANSDGRIITMDNRTSGVFAVTLTELSMEDAGLYWCGITIIGYDNMVPLQLNIFEPLATTTLPKEPQKTISWESESTSNVFIALVVPVLGALFVVILITSILVARCRKKSAAGKKKLAHTEEESNPVDSGLLFRDIHGQDITYDMDARMSSFQREDFPPYI